MSAFESIASVLMLGGCIWVLRFLLPRARRGGDGFGVVCSLLTALVCLFGFLFIGVAAISR
jgi:hypothetical protein